MSAVTLTVAQRDAYRHALKCGFTEVDDIFDECLARVIRLGRPGAVDAYLCGATVIAQTGRGLEPVLLYLNFMPGLAASLGPAVFAQVAKAAWQFSQGANGRSVHSLLRSVDNAAPLFFSFSDFDGYHKLLLHYMQLSGFSVHDSEQATFPSPAMEQLLQALPRILQDIDLDAARRWVDHGMRFYSKHPDRQRAYFSLNSPDSRAIVQRERSGTLCEEHRRCLDLYLRGLWQSEATVVAFSVNSGPAASADQRLCKAYYDEHGYRLPDVFHDFAGVRGIDRYRALLAHMAAHQRWSSALVADNFSPLQRLAIEVFEDSRIERLAMAKYPGLRNLWMALHPSPGEHDVNLSEMSGIRHRLCVFSRAVLDASHRYTDTVLLEFVTRFEVLIAQGAGTEAMAALAVLYIARTRCPSDLLARVSFVDTDVSYRDDNRHLWLFIEQGDEEAFPAPESLRQGAQELHTLPPKLYAEWDYQSRDYKPEWVSVYEYLAPAGDAELIETILQEHRAVCKQLKRLLDHLKPQDRQRERYQEDGTELDLDVALRAWVDHRSGVEAERRINMHYRHNGRDIAVMLLLDLSESLKQCAADGPQSVLDLSREAVTLLAWAISHLGDELAIAGFQSNTREQLLYQHIKGFNEAWDAPVKARLAATEARYSTRMGAALRHAAKALAARSADKKLLLVLSDGEPYDVDEADPEVLISDAQKAVQEISQKGIYAHCVSLDAQGGDYSARIFGKHYTVVDRVQRLPAALPKLFLSLTR